MKLRSWSEKTPRLCICNYSETEPMYSLFCLFFLVFLQKTKKKCVKTKLKWLTWKKERNITFHQRWSAYINKWTLAAQQPCVLIQRLVYMFNPGLLLQIKTGTLLAIADFVPDGWLEFTPYSILNEKLSLASLSHKAWSFVPSIQWQWAKHSWN